MKKVDTLQKPSLRYKEKKFEYKRSLTEYIAIGTLIFLTGSFLNNFILMMTFNINVSNYYEAKDYIASSSHILTLLALSIIFGIILAFIEDKIKKKFEKKKVQTETWKYTLKLLILLSIFVYVLIFAKFSIIMISIIITTFLLVILSGFLTSYIKNQENQMIAFIACAFHILIITLTIVEIKQILNTESSSIYHLKENKDLNINSTQHIKTTSKYSFFYDKQNKQTIVIPNTDIIRIEQITNELLE